MPMQSSWHERNIIRSCSCEDIFVNHNLTLGIASSNSEHVVGTALLLVSLKLLDPASKTSDCNRRGKLNESEAGMLDRRVCRRGGGKSSSDNEGFGRGCENIVGFKREI